MPERVSSLSWSRLRAPLTRLTLLAAAVAVTSCTESLEGGAACPSLCPVGQQAFRDTTIEAVTLDTSLAGFPTLGLSPLQLLANRPDTVIARMVLRFDKLATAYFPTRIGASDSITAVDSVFLRLPLDVTGRLGTELMTIEAFDVDTTASDSVQAVVGSLFRPDRLLGSTTFVPSTTPDSLRVPLSKALVQAKIVAKARLRIGLRVTGASGQVRVITFQSGAVAPTLTYDPTTDTTFAPIFVAPSTALPTAPADVELSYQIYQILDQGSPALSGNTLVVGGLPSARTYLRFVLPPGIIDSSTIVRAELLLTQIPSTYGRLTDSIAIVPLVPTTSASITDIRRVLDLAAEGRLASLDSTRFLAGGEGVRRINVLPLARTWPLLQASVPRAIGFRLNNEGAQVNELRFYSSEAAASLRPRLRITYLPRTEFALP